MGGQTTFTDGDGKGLEFDRFRKVLAKASPEILLQGDLLADAMDFCRIWHPVSNRLNVLSLLLVLFRQLKVALAYAGNSGSSEPVMEMVYQKVAPALRPGGVIAALLTTSMQCADKAARLRACDVLTAAGRMVDLIRHPVISGSTPTSLLGPMFQHIIQAGIYTRSSLALLNIMIEHVPRSIVSPDLLERLLSDLDSMDAASVRCSVIVKLLSWRRDSAILCSTERLKDEKMLEPLIPYFETCPPAMGVTHLTRYLLPMLFKAHPSSAKTLLRILNESDASSQLLAIAEERRFALSQGTTFPSWVSVASLAVSLGHISIVDLPRKAVADAIAHEEVGIRLGAFRLVTSSKDLLGSETIHLIQESMRWNSFLPSAGDRSEFGTAIHSFFVNIRLVGEIAHQKSSRSPDSTDDPHITEITERLKTFQSWLLDEYLNPLLHLARRPCIARAILALSVLTVYLDVFGGDFDVHKAVFTSERAEDLLACQASEYSEVRQKARAIIDSSLVLFPGYEHIASSRTRTLTTSAFTSLSHPRKTQAEAGKGSLCFVFSKLVQRVDDEQQARTLTFVIDIVGRLDEQLCSLERGLAKGIEEHAIHGYLAAVRDLLRCMPSTCDLGQIAWRPTFHRLFDIVNRVWSVTRQVISLAPSDPLGESESLHAPAKHEIARAYEVLASVSVREDADDPMDHKNLLSGCWRATMEASELLSSIFALPISHFGASQTIWDLDDVFQAGQCFLTWLHEVRHRGTFSVISLAFARLVEAVKSVEVLRDLREVWLDCELEIITHDSVSSTRRSAALPYSVLAIVSSDHYLLDKTCARLIELARVDNENSSDLTRIHAFNILKVVLLDARQTKTFDRYFEKAVMTALKAFASSNWNVRNVGLILFSTFVNRSVASGCGSQDFFSSRSALATRQTLATWHDKYPSIVPFVRDYLLQATDTSREKPRIIRHSPLFPILVIIRSLQWSEQGRALQESLIPAVNPYLSSPEWQIREVAAQALSSLISPEDAIWQAVGNISSSSITSPRFSLNALDGRMLLSRHLIAEVINWADLTMQTRRQIEGIMVDSLERHMKNPGCPVILTAVFEGVMAYLKCTRPISTTLVDAAVAVARTALNSQQNNPQSFHQPGRGLLVEVCTNLLMAQDLINDIFVDLSSTAYCEDQHLIALQNLSLNPKRLTTSVLIYIIDRASTQKGSNALRIAALQALTACSWPQEVTAGIEPIRRRWACNQLQYTMLNTKCVPLKEALLPALGCLSSWWNTSGPNIEELTESLLVASHADQSQPSRLSAVQCMSHLTPFLFVLPESRLLSGQVMLSLHGMLLRLLQDDDDEIRRLASSVVSRGLGVHRPVVLAKAIEIWWDWLDNLLSSSPAIDGWIEWLWELCVDASGFATDLNALGKSRFDYSEVLFEVEQSNLFRDPLVDAEHASILLAKHSFSAASSGPQRAVIEALQHKAENILATARDFAPIDDAWESRRVLLQRLEIQRSALAGPSTTKEMKDD